ncbi:MAG: helicase associated domain-containing protein [Planctomycetes bacterium]|nr:helicase associated domain-containing protein [Planctomycetota bacterium]
MWDDRLQELLAFRRAQGHVDVPRNWVENPGLARWVVNLRRQIRTGRLQAARFHRLEKENISWPSAAERRRARDAEWERSCDALRTFVAAQGHADLPSHHELGAWAARQRHQLRTGQLREDRRKRLSDLGIGWPCERGRSRTRDRDWDRMCDALAAFRRDHGDCRVPKEWPEHPKLARWVVRQRHLMRNRSMRPDRLRRLEELGMGARLDRAAEGRVSPGRRERAWRRMIEALAEFKRSQGHGSVPRRWPQDPALARWVSHQRDLRRRGRLPADHLRELEALGFEWIGSRTLETDRDSAWERQFSRLVAYRLEHGACDVPARWEQDPALGRWVIAQRSLRRAGRLSHDRLRRLSSVGFSWDGNAAPAARRGTVAT